MKKTFYYIIFSFYLFSCSQIKPEAVIKGEISGIENGLIYIYGADELSDIVDTIQINGGRISHTIPVDTLLQVMMVIDNKIEYPLYLDKGKKITIKGNPENGYLDIKGVLPNEEITGFYKSVEDIHHIPDSVTAAAEKYIRQNQTSFISIYLLDKYFVQKTEPDVILIKELISDMDGILQDKPYIERISNLLEESEKAEAGKPALSFTMKNTKGENITRMKYRSQYVILSFWASWCDSCRTNNAELRKIYNTYKKRTDFDILGISLDMDKTAWLEGIKKDTLDWEQVCDFTGPDNSVAKQYAVHDIPYNILLGTDGRVLERNIKGERLTEKLEEILKDKDKK